jgi:hypothetical protein
VTKNEPSKRKHSISKIHSMFKERRNSKVAKEEFTLTWPNNCHLFFNVKQGVLLGPLATSW